jgi:hypothetical protein
VYFSDFEKSNADFCQKIRVGDCDPIADCDPNFSDRDPKFLIAIRDFRIAIGGRIENRIETISNPMVGDCDPIADRDPKRSDRDPKF